MSADADLAKARLEADAAKRRLMEATHTLQARVAPQRLASDALETARERAEAALDGAKKVARRRPVAIAAAALGLVAFFARRRILAKARRRRAPDRIKVKAAGKRALPRPTGDEK